MTYFTFYGTMERYFDPAFNKRVLIATFDMEIAVTDVVSKQEEVLFSECHVGLKAMIAAINAAFNEGRISLSKNNRWLREEWIPATEVFADNWGLHMVVYDVRKAITSVRHHLRLASVVWPKIYLVNNEADGVITPGNVDEFGKAILDENGKTIGSSVAMART